MIHFQPQNTGRVEILPEASMAGYLSHICGYVRTLRHSQKEKPLPLATANDCSVKALLQTLSRVIAPWYFILYMKTSIRSVGSRDFYVDTPEMGSSFCCSLAVFKTSTAAFRSSSLPAISSIFSSFSLALVMRSRRVGMTFLVSSKA